MRESDHRNVLTSRSLTQVFCRTSHHPTLPKEKEKIPIFFLKNSRSTLAVIKQTLRLHQAPDVSSATIS
jgi:hypothetical protein